VATPATDYARRSAAREKSAVVLLIGFLAAWILTMIVIQIVQIHQNGYGSGFNDGGRIPASVERKLGVPDGQHLTLKQLQKATNR
jgi:hypothetical protein